MLAAYADKVLPRDEPIKEDKIRTATDASGNRFHGRAVAVPLRTADGSTFGVIELVNNVTRTLEQRRRIEDVQQQVSSEIDSSLDELHRGAALAGEEGQGFSVVADEVKTLAEETQTDTGGYKKLDNFDPPWGRISVRIYSHQYEAVQISETVSEAASRIPPAFLSG